MNKHKKRSAAKPGCLSLIPDLTFFHHGSQIRIFPSQIPKKCSLSYRKYDPGCSSRIPDPDHGFLPILDPRSKGQKRHRIRIRNNEKMRQKILIILRLEDH
jgi:hypothetical protein